MIQLGSSLVSVASLALGLVAFGSLASAQSAFERPPRADRWYSITVLTSFVSGLERIGPVPDRSEVIALAATAANEDQARFLTGCVQMLAHHHERVARLREIRARATVVGMTASGGVVVAAPVDYVSWTERISGFARRPDLKARSRDLWLTGRISPRARQEFERVGWGSPTATQN